MYRNCILEDSNHFTINSIQNSFCINIEVKNEKCDFTDKGGGEQAEFHDVSTFYALLNISYEYAFIQIFRIYTPICHKRRGHVYTVKQQ